MSNDFRQRLFSRLTIDPEGGCLLWTRRKDPDGYGIVDVKGRPAYVHRIMYELFVGEIPEGLQLDHLCRVRHCASPAHLEAVTCRENVLRSNGVAAVHAAATHCPAGHEYDLVNTYWNPSGWRDCRTCRREADRRYRQRKAGAA